ncbi:unnamed protein product [Microthlaspi erraticum]|uniref:Uncharacterized protein n=1 Tax=Microthlaspi erraticum TaxID=1685480 RepID=A0A6D2JMF8_9BRAS|nr:unnamed protein product [Microthlaspi erraticum]
MKSLDRVSRDFVWGSIVEKRKQHLIGWEKLCRPKTEGGLGIHKSSLMNKVFCEIIKGSWSSTWRSVTLAIKDVILPGHGWVIGDGKRINFWTDKWLMGTSLCDLTVSEIPLEVLSMKAGDLWTHGLGWDFQRITPYVSVETKLEMAAVVVNSDSGRPDTISWGEAADGKFTVASAYRFLTERETFKRDMSNFFKCVWRVRVLERVQVFFWLVGNHGIMTNQE